MSTDVASEFSADGEPNKRSSIVATAVGGGSKLWVLGVRVRMCVCIIPKGEVNATVARYKNWCIHIPPVRSETKGSSGCW